MGSRWHAVAVDATDPARLGRWWAEVLGLRILHEEADDVVVGGGGQPTLHFTRSDQPTPGRNRLHLDLEPDDRDAEVERLVNMGARHVDIGQDDHGRMMLADPEGNEFRVLMSSHGPNLSGRET
jgi:catechol-2,3-dioxygenase